MANALYPAFKSRLISPGADLVAGLIGAGAGTEPTAAPLKAALLAGYTYAAAHDFFNDISASVVGDPVAVTGGAVAAGAFDADDTVFSAVAEGSTIGAVALYMDTGTPATSPLVALVDTGTGGALAIETSGGNITIKWDDGASKIFTL
ncbi:hypothetical protein ACRC7T_18095 [Segnochrobactraceae bacterium EtOH-i3]